MKHPLKDCSEQPPFSFFGRDSIPMRFTNKEFRQARTPRRAIARNSVLLLASPTDTLTTLSLREMLGIILLPAHSTSVGGIHAESKLLAALQSEIRRHNFSTFYKKGVVVPGCRRAGNDSILA